MAGELEAAQAAGGWANIIGQLGVASTIIVGLGYLFKTEVMPLVRARADASDLEKAEQRKSFTDALGQQQAVFRDAMSAQQQGSKEAMALQQQSNRDLVAEMHAGNERVHAAMMAGFERIVAEVKGAHTQTIALMVAHDERATGKPTKALLDRADKLSTSGPIDRDDLNTNFGGEGKSGS